MLGHCCPSQGCISVFEDKGRENCLTKRRKFQLLCTCYPRSPVTGLSGAQYIPNTCWNKQHTRLSSDEYSIWSCLLSEPDEFTQLFFFFSYSNAKTKSQGRHVDSWHSEADNGFKNQGICCFHSYSVFYSPSLSLTVMIFWWLIIT